MKFNPKQRKIFIGGIVIFLLVGAFPPWNYTFKAPSIYSEKSAGYSFIMSPPPPWEKHFRHGVKIDISRLVIQWIITIVATASGLILTAGKKESPPKTEPSSNPEPPPKAECKIDFTKGYKPGDYKELLRAYQEEVAKKAKVKVDSISKVSLDQKTKAQTEKLKGELTNFVKTPLVYAYLIFGAPIGNKMALAMNPGSPEQAAKYVFLSVIICGIVAAFIGYFISLGIDVAVENETGRMFFKVCAGIIMCALAVASIS